jgi:FkbM family methyltransferase
MINNLKFLFKKGKKKSKEYFLIKKLDDVIGEFKIIFDVGAFKGNFVDEILKFNKSATVHCFEPYIESYDFLHSRFHENKNIFINNFAVSDYFGKIFLNVNNFLETNSLLESQKVDISIDDLTETKNKQIVSVFTLNDYCLEKKIDLIDLVKIDTQGNTFQVLIGLSEMLKAKKVKYLYLEAEFVEIYKNEKLFAEIDMLMNSFNYQIIDFYNLNYINNYNLAWCDVLYGIKSGHNV